MRSSGTITLFSEQKSEGQRSSSVVASIVVHGAVIALVAFVLIYRPQIGPPVLTAHYTVRQLNLRPPTRRTRQARGDEITYPAPSHNALAHSSGGSHLAHPRMLRQVVKAQRGPQTLVQPDITAHIILKKKILLPTVAIWTPVKVPVRKIVPPRPQQPVQANATPTLQAPNDELRLDKIEIASVKLPTENLPIVASTTSPVEMHGPKKMQKLPATATQTAAQPTPAAVVSLSSLAALNGPTLLPPINETVASASPGVMALSQAKNTGATGKGNEASKAGGSGPGTAEAGKGKQPQGKGKQLQAGGTSGSQQGTQTQVAQGQGSGSGTSAQPGTTHITLPKNGQFGAIVVGDSLAGEFPELAGVWSGRMAYTVYLHVGLAQSWILQYALPRAADAANAGRVPHLEAPWPYNIVRPNLPSGSVDANVLLVHGYVDQSGHFQDLTVAFPPNFSQAQFVLKSLRQWEFRPATENGQNAKVEVLLIIPEEVDFGSLRPLQTPLPQLFRVPGLTGLGIFPVTGR